MWATDDVYRWLASSCSFSLSISFSLSLSLYGQIVLQAVQPKCFRQANSAMAAAAAVSAAIVSIRFRASEACPGQRERESEKGREGDR